MTIRNATATALFATMFLISGAALAAPPQNGVQPSFDRQLSETTAALLNHSPAGIGREERLTIARYLQIAADLARQGQTAKGQVYLNLARGELGLMVSPDASSVSAEPFLSSSRDFYNPNI